MKRWGKGVCLWFIQGGVWLPKGNFIIGCWGSWGWRGTVCAAFWRGLVCGGMRILRGVRVKGVVRRRARNGGSIYSRGISKVLRTWFHWVGWSNRGIYSFECWLMSCGWGFSRICFILLFILYRFSTLGFSGFDLNSGCMYSGFLCCLLF
jgi:hypothetical protein